MATLILYYHNMRIKILLIFTSFFALYLLVVARSGGLANILNQDRTGSPFSQSGSCASCHSGGNFSPSVSFNLLDQTNSPVTSYIPGNSYIIEYNVTNGNGNPSGFGIQGIGLLSNNQTAGSLGSTITPNTRISNIGSRQYIEQNGLNSAGNFRVNWTAPATGSGNITFYYTGLAANGNGGSSGDQGTAKVTSIITEGCLTPAADFGFSVNGALASFNDLSTNNPGNWLWDFGDGNTSTQQNPNHSYTTPGTYTVCLTSSTCVSDFACKTVVILCTPSLSLSVMNQVDILCAGDSTGIASITTGSGTGPFTYAWSNGGTDSVQNGLSAGTYHVMVSDSNACTDSISIQIQEPQPLNIAFNAVDIGCSGDSTGAATASASGGIGPYIYSWSNGSADSSQANLAAGIYTVYVTDANACYDSLGIHISQPSNVSITVSGTDITCFGDSTGTALAVVSGGTPDFNFLWSSGDTIANPSNLLAGEYYVTVTDSNGCTASDTLIISQNPEILISFDELSSSCYGDSSGSVSAMVSGGVATYQLTWETGDTTPDLVLLPAGNYGLTVTDSLGCTIVDTARITQPDSLSIGFQVTNETAGMDGSIDLSITGGTSPYSFIWSNGDTTEDISSLIAGIYTVSIRDFNGCSITDSVEIDFTSSLEENESFSAFTLFPNPSQGEFLIQWDSQQTHPFALRVWDLQGKLVYENLRINHGEGIQLNEVDTGIYIVEAELNGKKFYQKLVIRPQ
ncbi:MAG: choice-of-anchor V domain-containing protein [Bacteroidia bacterium]